VNSAPPAREDPAGRPLDLLDAVGEWFVDEAERHLANGDLESCLRSAHVAASVWVGQNRRLVVPRLEALIQQAARRLDDAAVDPTPQPELPASSRPLCLHVMEEALPAGGLTSMATRWIRHDSERSHAVALLAQHAPVPTALHEAARSSGGDVVQPPAGASFVARARWLRALCRRGAHVVVLHVGVSDVVFATALGVRGGPPVALVNHAAHAFWVGSTVVDLVLNCRGSEIEARWTALHRGARGAIVPIPLDAPQPLADAAATDAQAARRAALRDALGVPRAAPVMLTVGATYKFSATRSLDFVAALEGVLQRVPDAIVLAAGVPPDDDRWRAAGQRTQGRLRALGAMSHSRIKELHAIADVYVDGFPIGTTTSLLEAGLCGIPAVLAPATAAPPYGTDGIALDAVLERPSNVATQQEMLIRLLEDAALRQRVGDRLAGSIRDHHTGVGWLAHMRRAVEALPSSHGICAPAAVEPVDRAMHELWADLVERSGSAHAEVFEHAYVRARLLDLGPRLDDEIVHALRRCSVARRGRGLPGWALRALINGLLPLLPHRQGTHAFRAIAWLSRRIGRASHAAVRPRKGAARRSWYADYRDIETRAVDERR
jgi:glycosyltransferase involved in cell wall biosynthesis